MNRDVLAACRRRVDGSQENATRVRLKNSDKARVIFGQMYLCFPTMEPGGESGPVQHVNPRPLAGRIPADDVLLSVAKPGGC
jgi:hypothetical protein